MLRRPGIGSFGGGRGRGRGGGGGGGGGGEALGVSRWAVRVAVTRDPLNTLWALGLGPSCETSSWNLKASVANRVKEAHMTRRPEHAGL
ncbi:hypothetical protein GUJ93_ZPchr0006g45374 [Zizania palustris]|uniref:Uncharacterized protein n=1 Tax=Zizania palustris TaxID=103762 RepID=A0A8J5TA77_ZIZPA|nr:hypothetical protein GUJ93_ZPchr0006g45374 [Zizania palustris]